MKSITTLSAAAAVLSGTAEAFWRMDCHSRSGLARIDPIVTPGKISSHAHAIHGGGSKYQSPISSVRIRCMKNQNHKWK